MKMASFVTRFLKGQQFVSSSHDAEQKLLFVRCTLVVNWILGCKYLFQPDYVFWRKKGCRWFYQVEMAVIIYPAGQHCGLHFDMGLTHRRHNVTKSDTDPAIFCAIGVRGVERSAMM